MDREYTYIKVFVLVNTSFKVYEGNEHCCHCFIGNYVNAIYMYYQ